MEVALILYMCSALQKTCLEPYVWPDRFEDKYSCMVGGYTESKKKIEEKILVKVILTLIVNLKIHLF